MAFWLKYLIADLTLGVAIALVLRQFVCLLALVKGNSMLDTLRNGEVLFALRRRLCGRIKRFDVILCKYPGRKSMFVKRVVGMPGERIRIDDDVLYINDVPVKEDFHRRRCLRPMTERRVGEDEYFVMGDNRPASRDSRSVGPIPLKDILAVSKCVVFPFRQIRKIR